MLETLATLGSHIAAAAYRMIRDHVATRSPSPSASMPSRDLPQVGRLGRRHPLQRDAALATTPSLLSPIASKGLMAATGRLVVAIEDADLRATLAFHLSWSGLQVLAATDARELVPEMLYKPPMLVLLGARRTEDGTLRMLETLRATPALDGTAIICIDQTKNLRARAHAFALGADDYVFAPVDPEALLLRTAALLRRLERAEPAPLVTPPQVIGPIRLDCEMHEVSVHGTPVELTATEFKILTILAARRGLLHTRQDLLAELGRDGNRTLRAVDMHVKRLRDKLGEAGDLIETIRGFGYRMSSDR